MKSTHFIFIAELLCLCALPGVSYAQSEPSQTLISGFGTLGGTYNSSSDAGFIRDISQETKPGKQYTWRPDSRLGIQVSHSFSPQLQVTGQMVLRDQPTINLDTSVSRAFVSYRPIADLQIRIGRLADATFLMSDYYEVGYAYPWVRPPIESYGVMAPHNYDGADLTYSLRTDYGLWQLKGLFGRLKAEVPMPVGKNYMLESNDLRGVALIHQSGAFKARFGYSTFHLENEGTLGPGVQTQLHAFASVPRNPFRNEALALESDLEMRNARIGFTSLGFSYDNGHWMGQAEISDLSSETKIFPQGQQAYVSVGYHFGNFLPYLTIGANRAPEATQATGNWGRFGNRYGQLQAGALAIVNSQRTSQSTRSIGMRWDFDSHAALKVQWDQIDVRENGWGLWSTQLNHSAQADRVNIVSATIDFVF